MFGFTSSSENQLSSKSPSSLSLIATNSILKGMDINELIPHMKLPMGNIQAVSEEIHERKEDHGMNLNISFYIKAVLVLI